MVMLLGAATHAQDGRDADLTAAVSAFILQRFHSQPAVYPLTFPLVVGDSVPLQGTITLSGANVRIHSRAEARNLQLAWFIYFSKVQQSGNQVVIGYQTPFNASSGTGTMERGVGGWKLVKDEKMRSSSGSRMFYGELYEGVVCRDNTEMARHTLSLGGGLRDAPAEAKCKSEEFPQVAQYRQMKKIMGK
jgi:hypothetical protein